MGVEGSAECDGDGDLDCDHVDDDDHSKDDEAEHDEEFKIGHRDEDVEQYVVYDAHKYRNDDENEDNDDGYGDCNDVDDIGKGFQDEGE